MKELLMKAQEEILSLRRENEILRAKVEVINLFETTLHTSPARRDVGAGEDVAWLLRRELEILNSDANPRATEKNPAITE